MTKIIAVDWDDTCVRLLPALNAYRNKLFRTTTRLCDYKSYSFWETWGGSETAAVTFVDQFITEAGDSITPTPGALQALAQLQAQDCELVLVTSRLDNHVQNMEQQMQQYFPRIFSKYILAHNPHVAHGHNGRPTKLEICKDIGAIAMVDDSVPTILDIARNGNGIAPIIPDQPYNRFPRLDIVYRIKSMKELPAIISTL